MDELDDLLYGNIQEPLQSQPVSPIKVIQADPVPSSPTLSLKESVESQSRPLTPPSSLLDPNISKQG
jgi:hypothetical protein